VKQELSILPEEEQAEIVRRRLICAECPFNSDLAKQAGTYSSDRIDIHCIMCGCTIARKTASLSSACGITCCNAEPLQDCTCKPKGLKEYNEKNNINMKVKWEAFKTKEEYEQQTEHSN
jgi:hypothetical protein